MTAPAGETEVLEALADPVRLASLTATGLLSPHISSALDDLAALARDVLEVPVALATLVDPETQSFVGACGLDEPWATTRQMPLPYSFCKYVVASTEPLIVEDAQGHPQLRESPAVVELRVRAYAGYPIHDSAGRVLGSFCVVDTKPRAWTPAELRRVESMARVAGREVASQQVARELALTIQQTSELVDSALEAIVTADTEGRIAGWNRHAEQLFGWSAHEVLGRPVEDVIVPERLAHLHAMGFAKVASGAPSTLTGQRIRVPARHRDGHEFTVQLGLTSSVQGPDGVRFHAFMHDVSAEVAATEALGNERAFLRALLDSLETGVMASDAEGRPCVLNKALRRIHGLPEQGAVPTDWTAISGLRRADGSPMSTDEAPLTRACTGDHVRDVETVVHREGQEPRSFLAHGQPIEDEAGQRLGAVVALHEITELKRHERQREDMLQREQARTEELRQVSEERKQFVAVVSHELRNPLSTIIGFSQLLSEGASLPANQQKMLGIIVRSAQRMLGIVSDLLALEEVDRDDARAVSGQVELGPVVHDAVEAALPAARAASITVTAACAGELVVEGDEQHLRQVLDNLVGNAVKYTPAGGRVTVAVSGAREDGTTLTVTDTGIGIPEEERHRLFERFFRASTARSAEIPGTGLGLAVVRTIVEKHGGTISAAPNADGPGTTFTVWLPPYDGAVGAPESDGAASEGDS